MSIFNDGMNLASIPAMDQMGEVIYLKGIPIKVIIDPVDKSDSRIPGGKKGDAEASIFMRREDFHLYNVSKGDKITINHESGSVKIRINSIQDDGTDLLVLNCGAVLTGSIPR